MMRKEDFDFEVNVGLRKRDSDVEVIKELVDFLIMNLYEPDEEVICKVNTRKIKKLGLAKEAINWGDLSCREVERKNGVYIVYIEEDSEDCSNLKNYIESWLKKWGWKAVAVTNW